jgi:dUTP pyrophosphatase
VRGRSGWTERGVYVSTGTADSDYRGVVGIHVENRSSNPIEIAHGDRIAQLVIAQAPQARIDEAEELSETVRNTAGFGSTGVR